MYPKSGGITNMTQSSWIEDITYSPSTEALSIETKSGETYTYNGVDELTAESMMEADSVGNYHNTYIRGAYDCVKG